MRSVKASPICLRNFGCKIVKPLALVFKKLAIVDVASFDPCWLAG